MHEFLPDDLASQFFLAGYYNIANTSYINTFSRAQKVFFLMEAP